MLRETVPIDVELRIFEQIKGQISRLDNFLNNL